jgi:ribonucleoside-diphosphate reductase alpha chain
MKLFKGGAKGGTVYVDGSRDAQVLSLGTDDAKEFDIDEAGFEDIEATHEFEVEDATLRSDRQDRKIGIHPGDICPLCKEGTMVDSGGCNTCSNCNAQLKCGL